MLGVPQVLVIMVSQPQVPPDVVGELLRSTIEFPSSRDVERFRIEDERAAGSVAVGRAQRAHEDAVGSAVHGVRRCIARALNECLRLDHLHDSRLSRIGLRVENVNARRVDARHDQIPPLHVRMRRVRAQAGAAGVPAEVMQLIAGVSACRSGRRGGRRLSSRDRRPRRQSRRAVLFRGLMSATYASVSGGDCVAIVGDG